MNSVVGESVPKHAAPPTSRRRRTGFEKGLVSTGIVVRDAPRNPPLFAPWGGSIGRVITELEPHQGGALASAPSASSARILPTFGSQQRRIGPWSHCCAECRPC